MDSPHPRSVTNNNGQAANDPAPLEQHTRRIVAACTESDRIAFACFVEENNEMVLGDYRAHGYDTELVISQFYADTHPTQILINNKILSDGDLLSILTCQDPEKVMPAIPYRLVKSRASSDVRTCRSLILNKLKVRSLMRHHYDFDDGAPSTHLGALSFHSLSALIDFESNVLVRALGMLLTFLQGMEIFRMEEGDSVTVTSIRQAKINAFMSIDQLTLSNLHIFATEHHPLLAKGVGNSKEGFSLFTLLDRCKSKIGRQMLKEWMMKPLLDVQKITSRQDGVELFLTPECGPAVESIIGSLKNIGAVDRILLRMHKCVAAPNDFLAFSKTLNAALEVCSILGKEICNFVQALQLIEYQETLNRPRPRSSAFKSFLDGILSRCNISVLNRLQVLVTSIVDEEMTLEKKSGVVVKFGYNEELDFAKEEFEKLDETLSSVGDEILSRHPNLSSVKVVFLPQVGFLIAMDARIPYESSSLPPDFDFIFNQQNVSYFKNRIMHKMDLDIGDLDAFIKDTEGMIVSELEDEILSFENELRNTFSALAELDVILSFADCSTDLGYVRPEVVEKGDECGNNYAIYISNGRHPLQEIIVDSDSFIPNDTMIDENNSINMITGPNFSGKSCYTRQVGVLVYMAHLGCFLPCDRAKISITNQIMARMSNVETCAVPQSSFQLDLTQMATVLRKSSSSSLILVDEFGKGTAPASGIAVLTAAMRHLSKIKAKVICTTHFLEIFSLGLLKDNMNGIRVLRMAIHVPNSNDENPVPLFKLEQGVATSSAGLVCAKLAGLQKNVISRAQDILDAVKGNKPVEPIDDKDNANSAMRPSAKSALKFFKEVKCWKSATNEELKDMQTKISLM